jgi:urea transport system permease protein
LPNRWVPASNGRRKGDCHARQQVTSGILAHSGADPKPLIDALAKADFSEAERLIGEIALTGDVRAVPALEAFSEGDLYVRKADGLVFIGKAGDDGLELIEPITGVSAGPAPKSALTKIKINNNLRRVISLVLAER